MSPGHIEERLVRSLEALQDKLREVLAELAVKAPPPALAAILDEAAQKFALLERITGMYASAPVAKVAGLLGIHGEQEFHAWLERVSREWGERAPVQVVEGEVTFHPNRFSARADLLAGKFREFWLKYRDAWDGSRFARRQFLEDVLEFVIQAREVVPEAAFARASCEALFLQLQHQLPAHHPETGVDRHLLKDVLVAFREARFRDVFMRLFRVGATEEQPTAPCLEALGLRLEDLEQWLLWLFDYNLGFPLPLKLKQDGRVFAQVSAPALAPSIESIEPERWRQAGKLAEALLSWERETTRWHMVVKLPPPFDPKVVLPREVREQVPRVSQALGESLSLVTALPEDGPHLEELLVVKAAREGIVLERAASRAQRQRMFNESG